MVDQLAWDIEVIPSGDSVFMRAHRMHFSDGALQPGVFREQQGGMSVNWDRYASAEQTRQQAKKDPNANAVLQMSVLGIRGIGSLRVEHDPLPSNRAHTEVFGLPPKDSENLVEVRVRLLRITQVAISLADG